MADDRTREASKDPRSTTVLDPLRPAVVVRRRVYDAAAIDRGTEPPRAFTSTTQSSSDFVEDDESGPPSSINVARALASLRGDELQRVEELVRADEEAEDEEEEGDDVESMRQPAPEAAALDVPVRPMLTLGKSIALSELARRMGVPLQELPAALVARGFYALDAKTVLPRHTARVIAEIYGWGVEDGPPELDEPPPAEPRRPSSRIATKRKVGTKAKPKGKVKVQAKSSRSKPAKRRLAR